MGKTSIAEVKIKVESLDPYRDYLSKNDSSYIGLDHQLDTYFNIKKDRLKLRQGSIESTLIFYNRPNTNGHKLSDVTFHRVNENSDSLLEVLKQVHEIDVVVDKQREIYWIDNTKFHLDEVKGLGLFVEVEVMDFDGKYSLDDIHTTLDSHLNNMGLSAVNGVPESYSDLIRVKSE